MKLDVHSVALRKLNEVVNTLKYFFLQHHKVTVHSDFWEGGSLSVIPVMSK